jgi:hypothetical protein
MIRRKGEEKMERRQMIEKMEKNKMIGKRERKVNRRRVEDRKQED